MKPVVLLVVAMLLLEIPAAYLLDDPLAPEVRYYRILHLIEMLLLIGLTAAQFGLRGRVAMLVLAGLSLCFFGDIVNSFLIDLSHIFTPQTMLSIPFFLAAHICYIIVFVSLLRHPPAGARSIGTVPWVETLAIWPVLALLLWWLLVDQTAPPLLRKLSFGYAFIVTLMGVTAVLTGVRLGRIAIAPALGGLMFVVSDSIFGMYLLEGAARPIWVSQMIWVAYFLAQAGISRAPALRASPAPD